MKTHFYEFLENKATIEQLNIKTDKGNVKLGELVQVEVKSSTSYVVDLITCPEHKKSIFDALVKSNLNLNPQINQHTIYLTIPKVTREHRENVAKSAKLKCSQAIEKMKKVAAKAERKAQDAKHVSSDVVFNTVQFVSDTTIIIHQLQYNQCICSN